MTLVLAVATGQIVIAKKLKAQALCVKTAMGLQNDLARILKDLLKLNPEASRLRTERELAEARLAAALASANLFAITLAKAHRTSVILRQAALKAQQKILLVKAEARVQTYTREIRAEARSLGVSAVKRTDRDGRALAVSAHPATSPSPDYRVDVPFERRQTKFFSMDVPLATSLSPIRWKQTTHCGTTIINKENQWHPQIIQASALSKPRWP